IPVHVVEHHSDVLEILHAAIRRKKLPFEGLKIIHIDAHPDLALNADLSRRVVFQPRELYKLLEMSEGGIAEFLLPAVYQGHISHISWIKPNW
ncbi:unnamed protein product, partial [Heterosigma akashiwo]